MGKLISMACAVAAVTVTLWVPQPAEACGGFFCGQQPVDQTAERVVFSVNRDAGTTDMIVQISFQGRASDFAWVVPLGQVPVEGSLDTFPQGALTALDANSSPQVWGGSSCFLDAAAGGPPRASDDGEVIVHVREEVGPYDVAVVESEDPAALIGWLRDNEFRVTTPMEPYIAEYTTRRMKFLALRLQNDAKVSDIAPFRMTLPGTSPSVPLKMTALAAEPEMGIVVFIIGDQRYEGANWPNLTVPDDYLVYDWMTGRNNWTTAVARVVDEAGGQGWVTDTATPLTDYINRLDASTPADEEQAAAIDALRGLFEGNSYISRLYTRVSAEEMISDPIFRRSSGADVPRWREIISDEGVDECRWDGSDLPDVSPCDFMACGAGGRCAEARVDGATVAGCACVPGATARTTVGPDGRATMACQDMRMSFLNPGDRETPGSTPLPDPCIGFDCGSGSCLAMNMTPTCVCDRGMVAVGSISEEGIRSTNCIAPSTAVPSDFYDIRLPARPSELPAGRPVDVPPPAVSLGGGGCAAGGTGAGWLALALVFGLRRRR